VYRVVVPLDGTLHAERAIPWADTLARQLNAEIVLVRVIPPGDSTVDIGGIEQPGSLGEYEEKETEVRSYLQEISARLQESREGAWPAACEALGGDPGEAVAEYARTHATNLIVIAGHGYSGIGRLLHNSVTTQIVRDSGIPVLSVGPGAADRPVALPKTALVPLDNSELALDILEPLVPLARACSMRLILLRVLEEPAELVPVQGALIPVPFTGTTDPDASLADLDQTANVLRAQGLEVEEKVSYGDRARAILSEAGDLDVDMIAMATHSLTGLGHWLVRSMAEEVSAKASVPVLEYHALHDDDGHH